MAPEPMWDNLGALDQSALKRGFEVEEPLPSSDVVVADRIDITVPARPEYVAVVRLATAGVAGRAGLSFDDTEDLKLVAGEACNIAILSGALRLSIRFEVRPDRLTMRVAHDGRSRDRPMRENELGLFLIRCLMDEVRTRATGAQEVITVAKRLQR